ncbi:MAG: hypothetical protein ACOC33_03630 [bacterium]
MSTNKIDYKDVSALPNDYIRKCGSKYDNEREIFQLAQMEAYNQRGTPCFYYVVDYDEKYDKIWGEDGNRLITHYFSDVMVYYKFQRDDKLWSKFGIEDMSTFSMYISKEHFRDITKENDISHIPQQGDIIQTQYNNYLYEVVERKETNGMYLLSKQYTWELIVRMFKVESNVKLSSEIMDAPITKYIEAKDIFDVSNVVDSEKENVLYKPKTGENPVNNPFGNW